jgi:hypothetical protein
MLKSFVEKLTELATPKTYETEGAVYASRELFFIDDKKRRPRCIDVTGLDSICKLVRNEAGHIGRQIFVRVSDYKEVSVFTTLDSDEERFYLYKCAADTPSVTMGRFLPYENAVIEIRSLYIPTPDTDYLLKLLASVSTESKVTSSDNGVTQKVEAKAGIALSTLVEVKPRVVLKPFRTFVEVDQPESEFLLRISDKGEIGLFPADGGVWKLEATRNVAGYFEKELHDLIEAGAVVVIR